MPAFIVFLKEKTRDQATLDIYSAGAPKSLDGHALTPRVVYGAIEVLEGPEIEGAVIFEFPDMAAARNWYYSPAYQEVVQLRFKAADYSAFILEGV